MPARRSPKPLRAGHGAVVNVASQAALVSLPQQAAYSASKGAVAALTRSLAIDWAEHGVRVNAVAPGFTVTPMTEAFFENQTFTQAATRRIPLGRLLQADEIAAAIVFLASPLASAITGVVLPVDGGWTAGAALPPLEDSGRSDGCRRPGRRPAPWRRRARCPLGDRAAAAVNLRPRRSWRNYALPL